MPFEWRMLSNGMIVVFDRIDRPLVESRQWWAQKGGRGRPEVVTWYAASSRSADGRACLMHRMIIGASTGECVDHVNGDGLDNRRCNLRIATRQQNQWNRVSRIGASRFKGVRKMRHQWICEVRCGGKSFTQVFDTEEMAARAYDVKASELFGEFARLNLPGELRESEHLVATYRSQAFAAGTSNMRGVSWKAREQRWQARVEIGGLYKSKLCKTEEEAAALVMAWRSEARALPT